MPSDQENRALSRLDRARSLNETLLDLGDLGLERLPDAVWKLTNLTELDLSGNRLRTLPESISGLTQLRSLDLSYNRLEELPESLGRLENLRNLVVGGNPLKNPPPEIAVQGSRAVLAYLRDLSAAGEQQWRSKVVVLGEAKVGKTSLVKRLSGRPFNPAEPMTHGVNVTCPCGTLGASAPTGPRTAST
jgi:Leucine-rich repeat (LRR) protein